MGDRREPGGDVVSPVMALLRVKAPSDTDPHVLEAGLTRALCAHDDPPLTAEVTWLPAWRRGRVGARRFGFVALLCSPVPMASAGLVRAAEDAAARELAARFGPDAAVRARVAEDPRELSAFWCAVRGTPWRPS